MKMFKSANWFEKMSYKWLNPIIDVSSKII